MLAMMAVVGKLVGHQHPKQIYLKSLYIINLHFMIPARLRMLAMLAKGLNPIFIDIKKTLISQHCQQFTNCILYTWLTEIYTFLFYAYISANTHLHVPTKEESCLFSL